MQGDQEEDMREFLLARTVTDSATEKVDCDVSVWKWHAASKLK